MFWERFYALCNENNTTPTAVVKAIGVSHGVITKWKNGTNPTADVLAKLSGFFGVSMDYLMGMTDTPQKILKVITLDDIDNLDEDADLTDTVLQFTAKGTLEEIEQIEKIVKQHGKYYRTHPVPIDEQKNKTDSDERSLTETEKELLAVTADMDEDEKNALLGYAARLIAKRKKED